MEQINKYNRCCATCEYWLGHRTPNRLGYVEVTSKMSTGRCSHKALTETREYQAMYSCSFFRKWGVVG